MKQFFRWIGAPLAVLILAGCTRDGKFQPVDMWNGSRLKPYEQVNFFNDKNSARPIPPGTVARGQLHTDEPLYYGTQNGTLVTKNPLVADAALLQRGQERYNIYCQPCHGLGGYGDGMIVKRGFAQPPSYHIQRLREVPDGHFFDVITNGYGSMYSYAGRIPTRDRWAIAAYIRVLQRSQNAKPSDMPAKLKPGEPMIMVPGQKSAHAKDEHDGDGGAEVPHSGTALPGQMPNTSNVSPHDDDEATHDHN